MTRFARTACQLLVTAVLATALSFVVPVFLDRRDYAHAVLNYAKNPSPGTEATLRSETIKNQRLTIFSPWRPGRSIRIDELRLLVGETHIAFGVNRFTAFLIYDSTAFAVSPTLSVTFDVSDLVLVITTTLVKTNRVPRIVRRPSASPPRKYPTSTATTGFT